MFSPYKKSLKSLITFNAKIPYCIELSVLLVLVYVQTLTQSFPNGLAWIVEIITYYIFVEGYTNVL